MFRLPIGARLIVLVLATLAFSAEAAQRPSAVELARRQAAVEGVNAQLNLVASRASAS